MWNFSVGVSRVDLFSRWQYSWLFLASPGSILLLLIYVDSASPTLDYTNFQRAEVELEMACNTSTQRSVIAISSASSPRSSPRLNYSLKIILWKYLQSYNTTISQRDTAKHEPFSRLRKNRVSTIKAGNRELKPQKLQFPSSGSWISVPSLDSTQ